MLVGVLRAEPWPMSRETSSPTLPVSETPRGAAAGAGAKGACRGQRGSREGVRQEGALRGQEGGRGCEGQQRTLRGHEVEGETVGPKWHRVALEQEVGVTPWSRWGCGGAVGWEGLGTWLRGRQGQGVAVGWGLTGWLRGRGCHCTAGSGGDMWWWCGQVRSMAEARLGDSRSVGQAGNCMAVAVGQAGTTSVDPPPTVSQPALVPPASAAQPIASAGAVTSSVTGQTCGQRAPAPRCAGCGRAAPVGVPPLAGSGGRRCPSRALLHPDQAGRGPGRPQQHGG